MIDTTIHDIEERIRTAGLTEGQKKDLQNLVDRLKEEVHLLAQTHPEAAARINQEGIKASLAQFEKSHPVLTKTVNDIATYFANLGL